MRHFKLVTTDPKYNKVFMESFYKPKYKRHMFKTKDGRMGIYCKSRMPKFMIRKEMKFIKWVLMKSYEFDEKHS